MSSINQFLLKNNLRVAQNPCVSPDFCLDWPALLADVKAGKVTEFPKSRFASASDIGNILLFPGGRTREPVFLSDVATVKNALSPANIRRENQNRRIEVQGDVITEIAPIGQTDHAVELYNYGPDQAMLGWTLSMKTDANGAAALRSYLIAQSQTAKAAPPAPMVPF